MTTILFRVLDKITGNEVFFKMLPNQPMKQRMQAYKERQCKSEVDFFFEGVLVKGTDTPTSLGLKYNSVVTVMDITGLNITIRCLVGSETQTIETYKSMTAQEFVQLYNSASNNNYTSLVFRNQRLLDTQTFEDARVKNGDILSLN